MTVAEIKEVLDINCLRAMKKAEANNFIGFYEHAYELLNATRDSLLSNGKRWTREWLETLEVLEELKEFKFRVYKLFL